MQTKKYVISRIDWYTASIFIMILWAIGSTYDGGWKECVGWTSLVVGYDIIAWALNKIQARRLK